MIALLLTALLPSDTAKVVDLKDGFVQVSTAKYVVEIPKGWEIGEQTSFGQREFKPEKPEDGQLGTMTGSARNQSWESLYRTSLFFIQRSTPGVPTPFKISKSEQGYEAMSFSMMKEDVPSARYVILKNTKNEILALSVKIPSKDQQKTLEQVFDRLVKKAKML